MNIRFHNLGTIKETELDLKPLTVIIGPNNSNKTYIAYSIYGLWQSIVNTNHFSARLDALKFQHQADGSWSTQVEALYKAFTAKIKQLVAEFVDELEGFYQDSSRALFSDTRFEIAISLEEFETALRSIPEDVLEMFGGDTHRLSLEQDRLVLSPVGNSANGLEGTSKRTQGQLTFDDEVSSLLSLALRRRLFYHPYLLPAERNAFIITYKVLANRRLKLMLNAQRQLFGSRQTSKRQLDMLRESGGIRYPQPIEDFLEFLFEVETEISPAATGKTETELHLNPRRRRTPQAGLRKLAGEIEQNIQNGNKLNFRATTLGGQEIMVDVGDGLTIDLYNASSSIKQLAPLLLYLRYRAAKGDLLIIDEPEMNLHPESQAKLLEVLAMLVNQGVYVLLTTHSPYLLAHLNNLAQAEDAPGAGKGASRRQAKSLYLGDPAALLRMDQVSAYEMRDGQLHTLKDPDYGIRWDTLSDVSVDLQQKYFQITEEGHTPKRGKPAKTSGK